MMMSLLNQDTVTGIGLALDLAAFVAITINERRKAKVESRLEEFEDYITQLEAITITPVEPLPQALTPEQRKFNQTADILKAAEQQAIRQNKENYLASKEDVRRTSEKRDRLNRLALLLIGLAAIIQIGALVL